MRGRWLLAELVTGAIVLTAPALGQDAGGLNEDLKLLPSDGTAGDFFGYSIAIHSGVVAVGADSDDEGGFLSGSAYTFEASTGIQLAKLRSLDLAPGDLFGNAISIDHGIVAVSAVWDDDHGSASGSVYLFDALTGAQLIKLTPSDGTVGDNFGISVAIRDGVVAIGSLRDDDNGTDSGSVYLFDAASGAPLAKLLPSDGAAYEGFGCSIAIDGGVVAVGAKNDGDNGLRSGSVYLFDVATGSQLAKLLASDGARGDRFGVSVSMSGGIVAVGALADDDNGTESGSAYLFDASTGAQLVKLLPSDGAFADLFGESVSIADGVVAVGARWDDDNGFDSGSAYLFEASTGAQLAKLTSSDGSAGDSFGFTVAISGGEIAVGANADSDNGPISGSAYVFAVPEEEEAGCVADLNGDGRVTGRDVKLFARLVQDQDPSADLNGDGVIDHDDFRRFIERFLERC